MVSSISVGGSINLKGFLSSILLSVVIIVTVVIVVVILVVVVVDDVPFILKLSFSPDESFHKFLRGSVEIDDCTEKMWSIEISCLVADRLMAYGLSAIVSRDKDDNTYSDVCTEKLSRRYSVAIGLRHSSVRLSLLARDYTARSTLTHAIDPAKDGSASPYADCVRHLRIEISPAFAFRAHYKIRVDVTEKIAGVEICACGGTCPDKVSKRRVIVNALKFCSARFRETDQRHEICLAQVMGR
ncbi:hypothetical protein Tco_1283529 [Tanacetum coccineum]